MDMKTHITCAFSSPWCLCYNFFELCGKCVANMRIGRIIEYDHENCNTNPTINWTNNSIWSWEIETNQYVKQQKKKKNNTKKFENKLDNHLKWSSSMHMIMLFSLFFHCNIPEVSTSILKYFTKQIYFPSQKNVLWKKNILKISTFKKIILLMSKLPSYYGS
jgi:hypothetical protein